MAKMNSLFPENLQPADSQSSNSKPGNPGRVAVSDLVAGQELVSTYLIQDASLRLAKNGSKYIQANFMDRTGALPARHWDATDKDFEAYRQGGYVKVRARVETYQTRLQMIVIKVETIDPETVKAGDFLPASTRSVTEMSEEFDALLESFKDPDYSRLLKSIFADPQFRTAFFKSPAATALHHAWLGGLLEHVLSACRTAELIAKEHAFLNRDLLVAGIILHDIGKVQELDSGPGFRYTDSGQLCGHIALGILFVERHILRLDPFPQHKRDLIQHMILSHHGSQEFGSPVKPCIPEAVALHYIECMDAKIQGFQTLIERFKEGAGNSKWTDWARIADGRIFTDSGE